MPMADVNGVTIHYTQHGAQDAPPLILSTSIGADLGMWDRQVEDFARHFHVVRYDTRGHGASSAPAGDYSIAMLAGDVLGLAGHLGIDRFNFCGLSLGGMTGQWLGTHHGARLIKLVLCCNSPKSGTPEMWQQRLDTVRAGGAQAVAAPSMERWFTQAFRTAEPGEVAIRQAGVAASSTAGYMGCCAAIRDMDQRETIAAITTPTLIIAGGDDVAAPVSDAELLHERIKGSRLEVIEGAAHLANIEKPGRFNRLVLDFLLE